MKKVNDDKGPETPSVALVSAGVRVVSGNAEENRIAPLPAVNWSLVEELSAATELTAPLKEQVATCVREQIKALCTIRYLSDDMTVKRLYYLGMILNNCERLLGTKSRFTVWREDCIGTDSGVVETSRQARKIAKMGSDILRFAMLGKNRVLEFFYLFSGMEEYKNNPNSEFIRNELGKIMAEFPFDIRPEMSQEDVQRFREHMDALISIYRIRKATGMTDLCSFDNALRIARARGLAIEVKQSTALNTMLNAPENRDRKAIVFQNWVNGVSARHVPRSAKSDPLRVVELFAKIQEWSDKFKVDQSFIAQIAVNPASCDAVKGAYLALRPLYEALFPHQVVEVDLNAAVEGGVK